MSHKDASASLKEQIALLEARQSEEKRLLKEELYYTFEHLKPSNVIKDSVLELVSMVQTKKNLFGTLFGTLSGYAASAVFGPKPTMLNKLGARFLQQIVAIAVTKNSPALTDVALNLVTNLRHKVERSRRPRVVKEQSTDQSGEIL